MDKQELDRYSAQLAERGFALHASEPSDQSTVKYALLDFVTGEPRVGLQDSAAALTWDQVEQVIDSPAGAGWEQTAMYDQHLSWWRGLSDEQRSLLLDLPSRQTITNVPIGLVTGGRFLFSSFAADANILDFQIDMSEAFWLFLDERREES